MAEDHTLKAARAADELVSALWPALEEYRDQKGTPGLTAVTALVKPYLRQALARIEGMDLPLDKRMVAYEVSAMFWDLSDDEDEPELIDDTDEDGNSVVCYGLSACMEQLAIWLSEVHEGEELSDEAAMASLVKRVPSLRVSIARGNGVGAFRVKYTADGDSMLAHATISRVSADDEDEEGGGG